MIYGWDLCWKRGSFLLSSLTIRRHPEMNYGATNFIAVLKDFILPDDELLPVPECPFFPLAG